MYAAAADRPQFAPPPPPGMLRAFMLAVLAHLLLLFALMHGLQWKREMQDVVAEAELWSALPREAAPREVVAPSPPPAPVVAPPVVRAPPMPNPQLKLDAQIAIEVDKREAAERAADKREAAERRRAELERDKQRDKQRKRDEAQAKQQEQARAVAEAKRKEEADTKRRARMREENLERMQGMAGTGSPSSTGMAAQSAGPSASWGGRVQARVRPNIVFTEDFSGNPKAEVEVRTSPDGTIVGKRLVRSSGVRAWDDAVLRALDKTESLPRDIDGRVPSPVVIEFRPRG